MSTISPPLVIVMDKMEVLPTTLPSKLSTFKKLSSTQSFLERAQWERGYNFSTALKSMTYILHGDETKYPLVTEAHYRKLKKSLKEGKVLLFIDVNDTQLGEGEGEEIQKGKREQPEEVRKVDKVVKVQRKKRKKGNY